MQIIKPENRSSSLLPIFAVGTFGLNLLALLLLMFHGSILQDLEKQLTPQSLVQLLNGRTITVDPKPNLERHPETIRRFVGETMSFLLTWSPTKPPKNIWDSSSGLIADKLQQKFQSEVIGLDPANQFENTNRIAETVLVLVRVSQPTNISEGKWKLQINANQLIFNNSDNLGNSVAFNKQVLVRAVDEPATKIPQAPLPLHREAHRLGQARLEIYNICDINVKDCY
ncbi:hypothetical protein [Fortiea contorta]|uniref:hypothetical protein n=1 Tax=Fortiea contorta TaxID=1892405 RepID=UPI0003465362|nr:hypothetical protein [Fortiea contorta]